MPKEKDLRDRIESVKGTRKITRAMGMIASSKIKKAQQRMLEARPFISKVEDFICNLGLTGQVINDRLVKTRENEKNILILGVTADKGLCGGYNSNIIELLEKNIRKFEKQDKKVRLDIIGTRGKNYFSFRGFKLAKAYEHLSDWPKFMDAREISRAMISRYSVGEVDRVLVCYTKYISPMQHEPRTMQILPIPIEQKLSERESHVEAPGTFICRVEDLPSEFGYEPSLKEIIKAIIPEYIFTVVYGILLESTASEIGARMTAMRKASDNSDDLIKQLTRDYHKIRQHQITNEIIEIISGAEINT
ncbi:MAG: ATP synthase F1 subunit gamma [Actinomycetia bacterium]|nr:ATP synthase F1 subunit gamma [Actinomycetes bacterium]